MYNNHQACEKSSKVSLLSSIKILREKIDQGTNFEAVENLTRWLIGNFTKLAAGDGLPGVHIDAI